MEKPKIVRKLSDKGYPTSSRHYKTAHTAANKAEKKKFPKGYEKLKKLEHGLKKHELMGTNKKSGKVEVEKKYKKYKTEIAYHEKVEHEHLKKLAKPKKKK